MNKIKRSLTRSLATGVTAFLFLGLIIYTPALTNLVALCGGIWGKDDLPDTFKNQF